MTDLEKITNIAHQPVEPLTSLDEIMDFLKLDGEHPLVYSVYKEVNKHKLTDDQVGSIDMAIKVLKDRHHAILKQNVEYMDKHLIEANINDDSC